MEVEALNEVVVHEPSIEHAKNHTILSTAVDVAAQVHCKVRYVLPPVQVHDQQAVDAFFLVARIVAMKGGWRIRLPGPVSPKLLEHAETHHDIFLEWFPSRSKPIPLDFEAAPVLQLPEQRGTMTTFSGGVDSYFTALENATDLTALLFVHGLDIDLLNTGFRSKVSDELAKAAADLGLPLWEVQTNVRDLTNPFAHWGQKAHGAVLSSIAVLLAQRIDTFLLPGTLPRGQAGQPWGSHVLTDRLNSTDYLSVQHHGVDVPRPAKTARIAESESALRHLRVCYSSETDYNCGRCSKCRRTMIDLDLAGAGGSGAVFAGSVPFEETLAQYDVTGPIPRAFALATIEHAGG